MTCVFSSGPQPAIPPNCFNGNPVERDILIQYMNSKNLTTQDVFNAVCAKIESGEFRTSA